jgi:hypothetical protein
VNRLLSSGLLCAALLWPAMVCAEDGDNFRFDGEPQWFALGGLSTGATFGSPGGGAFVGTELSFVWLHESTWLGGYTDAVYDFAQDGAVVSFGPELGVAVLGFDGGLGLRFGRENKTEVGYQARLLLDLGIFGLYGRYGGWPSSSGAKHVGQVGLLLKIPFWTTAEIPPTAR